MCLSDAVIIILNGMKERDCVIVTKTKPHLLSCIL